MLAGNIHRDGLGDELVEPSILLLEEEVKMASVIHTRSKHGLILEIDGRRVCRGSSKEPNEITVQHLLWDHHWGRVTMVSDGVYGNCQCEHCQGMRQRYQEEGKDGKES